MALKKPQATEALFKSIYDITNLDHFDGLKIAVIGGFGSPDFNAFKNADVDYIQTFKPAMNSYTSLGVSLAEELGEDYDMVIHFPTKFQEENLMFLAKALGVLKEGGFYIASTSNKIGAKGFERAVMELFPSAGSISKRKCRVVSVQKEGSVSTPKEWRLLDQAQKIADSNYISYTGVYGGNKIDKGSEDLINYLIENEKVYGHGADLGAGWGYLSDKLLEAYPNLRGIDLYEAEGRALKAAEENLKGHDKARFFHTDVVGESLTRKYDFVIMNPPFHNTEEEDIDLGRQFISKAKSILKPKGRLYMVANKHLPYEKKLNEIFTNVDVINTKGFKLILAK